MANSLRSMRCCLLALLLVAACVAGCASYGKRDTAQSSTMSLFKSDLRLPGHPRQRVGVDARSREIERDLGF